MQPAPGYLPWWMEVELELSEAMRRKNLLMSRVR